MFSKRWEFHSYTSIRPNREEWQLIDGLTLLTPPFWACAASGRIQSEGKWINVSSAIWRTARSERSDLLPWLDLDGEWEKTLGNVLTDRTRVSEQHVNRFRQVSQFSVFLRPVNRTCIVTSGRITHSQLVPTTFRAKHKSPQHDPNI